MTRHFLGGIRIGTILSAALATLWIFSMLGCGGTKGAPSGDEEMRLEHARALFQEGKYDGVVEELNRLMADRPGSRYVEESTFLIGRAYYEKGLYLDAEDQFRRYRREFPAGEFAAQASYHLGLALLSQSRGPQLDQSETRSALTQFNSFTTQYPDHELVARARQHVSNIRAKLAEKEYLNGKLYLRRGYQNAARFYFQERVLESYGDTPWAAPSMLGLAKSYAKSKEWDQAAEWARKLLEAFPEFESAEEARNILKKTSELVDTKNDEASEAPQPAASVSPR